MGTISIMPVGDEFTQGDRRESVDAFNKRGEEADSLIDPRLKLQQSLLSKSLKDGFRNQRGALSQAAQQAGGRRSTTYSNALGGQFKREGSVMSNLISQTLGKQIGLDEAQRGRDFTAEQAGLQRDLQREQFKQQMSVKQDALEAQKESAEKNAIIDTARIIGSLVAAPVTGGTSLLGLFAGGDEQDG